MKSHIRRLLAITTISLLIVALKCNYLFSQSYQVKTGIDVLEEENFTPLHGKHIGLITNQTGIDREWRTTLDVLSKAKNITLVAVFSPEHGIRGVENSSVASSIDSSTGLPIYSLFGETRRPTKEMLKGIDALVFDIQDIGTRFYTYIGTMKNCMEEAAKYGIEFIVLDRPNPINGIKVEGPVLDSNQVFALAGIHPIPIRHGMTVGELAGMFKADEKMNLNLKVIKMKGWRRNMWFDQTGLPWVNTSPNMLNLYEALLYPGIGLLERTNINDKRGLPRPFEMFGAPYVNSMELAAALNKQEIPGVFFVPIRFIPSKTKYGRYNGKLCGGVAIDIVDRNVLNSVTCGIEVLKTIYKLYPKNFDIEKIWKLTRSENLINQIKTYASISSIQKSWEPRLSKFKERRKKYLLY